LEYAEWSEGIEWFENLRISQVAVFNEGGLGHRIFEGRQEYEGVD
jgi:hypothetical protein